MLKNIDEENLNVPRGPEEVAETWRAWARLQIAVHTVFLWGHDLPATGVFYTTLSRITDHASRKENKTRRPRTKHRRLLRPAKTRHARRKKVFWTVHQFPKGPEDLLLPPVEQGEAPTVQSFHGKVLRHSFRAFIAKSSVEQGKAPTAEVTSCELRKKVGIYLCVYIHVNIIVKVEYSSRERSGLGATMAHQLKVERSKSCGQQKVKQKQSKSKSKASQHADMVLTFQLWEEAKNMPT